MVVSLQGLVFVAVLATVRGAALERRSAITDPDFDEALKLVEQAAQAEGNINYGAFCSETHQGAFKLACRIQAMNNVGLLVCLAEAGGECLLRLGHELDGLAQLRAAHLKVVPFKNQAINNLKCGQTADVNCSGFLVEWIPADQGTWTSLRHYIKVDDIERLVDWLLGYQNQQARLVTAADLTNIRNYMNPAGDVHNRICDLQGFFMKNGGFMIMDPDDVALNTPPDFPCHDERIFPTTAQVIQGLEEIIQKLKGQHMKI